MRLEDEQKSGNPWGAYPNISAVAVRGQGGRYTSYGRIMVGEIGSPCEELGCMINSHTHIIYIYTYVYIYIQYTYDL